MLVLSPEWITQEKTRIVILMQFEENFILLQLFSLSFFTFLSLSFTLVPLPFHGHFRS